MGYLQDKSKFAKYRVVAEIDQRTGDFPRRKDGTIDPSFNDEYIRCLNGNRIYAYGRGILWAYIPSIKMGKKILNSLPPGVAFDDRIYDKEVEFKFKYKDLETVAPLMRACVNRKDKNGNYHYISPYSTKNLKKSDFKLPDDKLLIYQKTIADLGEDYMRIISVISRNFLKSMENKRVGYNELKADRKKKGMKYKEYFYSIGKFDEYIAYIKKYSYGDGLGCKKD